MRLLLFICIISFCSCNPKNGNNLNDKQQSAQESQNTSQSNENQYVNLINTWHHSHEEDQEGLQVYRTDNYNFPPSRGRLGFSIKENNVAVIFAIARGDGQDKQNGKWLLNGKQVTLKFANPEYASRKFDIIDCTKDKLVIKMHEY